MSKNVDEKNSLKKTRKNIQICILNQKFQSNIMLQHIVYLCENCGQLIYLSTHSKIIRMKLQITIVETKM